MIRPVRAVAGRSNDERGAASALGKNHIPVLIEYRIRTLIIESVLFNATKLALVFDHLLSPLTS